MNNKTVIVVVAVAAIAILAVCIGGLAIGGLVFARGAGPLVGLRASTPTATSSPTPPPVAAADGVVITLQDFEKQVRYSRMQLIDRYWQLKQYEQFFGPEQFKAQLEQLQATFNDPETLGRQALDNLIEAALIRQEAKRRNVVVSLEEVDQAIREAFGYYPNGTPTPTAAPPGAAATPTPMPRPAVTPTPYTVSLFNRDFKDAVARLGRVTGMSETDVRRLFEDALYRRKLAEAWPATPQIGSVHARHILVADEATATKLIAQLRGGADFAALAQQYSLDASNKGQGGDLGYSQRGQMVAEFEQAAFNNPLGLIPVPVQTIYGWHVIEILDQQNETQQQAGERALAEWLSRQRADSQVVRIFEGWKQNVPVEPSLDPVASPTPYPTSKP